MPKEVNLSGIELRSIKGINRELAWRIESGNPYEHFTAKPRVIQRELKQVRGVGPTLAGEIYRKLVKAEEARQR